MAIAVSGSTGALGSLVLDALLERGVPASEVVALARDTAKAAPLADRGMPVRAFDYSVPGDLAGALEGVDRLLLISGTSMSERFAQHRAVIDAAVEAGVGSIFYTSVEAGAGGPSGSVNPVAPDHASTEAYLAESGIDHVVLRNGWYSENYLGQLDTAPQTGAVLSSAGQGRVASASRADYAAAAAAALTTQAPKQLYRLTGDVAWSTEDLAGELTEVLGTTVTVQPVTPAQHTQALIDAGLDEGTAGFVVGVDAAIADGELAHVTGELHELIGRDTTSLRETLQRAHA